MPRGARLDTPGALHHVMVRGIERGLLFRDDRDYADFVARLAQVVRRTGLTVLAWALLPKYPHLLVRTPSAQRNCCPVPFSGKPHWEPGDVLADNGRAKVTLFFVGGGKWTLDAPMAELEPATGSVVRRFEALAPMSARASQASRAFQGRLPREVATEVVGWARQGEF